MAYTVKNGKGVTYVKDTDGTWKPVQGMWQKTDATTWTPVVRANLKVDGTTWESVYPAAQGHLVSVPSTLTFYPYQYHTEPDNDLDGNIDAPPFSVTLQNTGDDNLTVQAVTVNNSAGYSVATTYNTLPFTIAPLQSSTITVRVKGLTVGSYNSGNIQIQSNVGVLGLKTTTIPLSVTVRPDYSDITVTPYPINITSYTTESPSTQRIVVKNSGNGANLNISSNTVLNGYITISNIPTRLGYDFTAFSGNTANVTVTAANLAAGRYSDTLTIRSNGQDRSTYNIPVNITVVKPQGRQVFSTPGTYSWTVPDHVYHLDLLTVAAGGPGGPGLDGVIEGGGGGGGGSGGSLYNANVAVTPGETLTITVGTGGGNQTPSQRAIYHPVSLSYAWSGFMNSYAVWTHPDGVTPTGATVTSSRNFFVPATGYYTFSYQADNYLEILVDDVYISTTGSYSSTTTTNVFLRQGDHNLTFNAANYGGPAGFAVVIQDSNSNIKWTTRTTLDPGIGSIGSTTTVQGSFGTIQIAGGEGGASAYESGVEYYGGDGSWGGGGDSDGGGGDG